MILQYFNLFPHMTVMENFTLAPMLVRKIPLAEAMAMRMWYLEMVWIPDQSDKFPGQLLAGQQQCVAMARALCMKSENPAIG